MTTGHLEPAPAPRSDRGQLVFAVIAPIAFATVMVVLDIVEGPVASYAGVLAVLPMFAAIQGTPRQVLLTGGYTLGCSILIGMASDGPMGSPDLVRLTVTALSVAIAALSSRLRILREAAYQRALGEAEHAEQLRRLAQTDELTGLLNRRGLLARLDGKRQVAPVTIAIADCDELKHVNDKLGHTSGDEYIRAIAGRLSRAVSRGDIVARWGGDEFLIVVQLPPDKGERVLERARHSVARDDVRTRDGLIKATISVGAAPWPPGERLDDALREADTALYEAKRAGRNTVVVRGLEGPARPHSGVTNP